MKNTNNIIGNFDDYLIRYPKPSDWKALWLFINQISAESTYISYQGEKISQQEEKKYLQDILAKIESRQAIQLVVESGDKIIGSANFNLKPRSENHVGVIGISILKPYRNRGIGTNLFKSLLSQVNIKIPQATIATLQVMSHNQSAIRLYQKLGFQQFGLLPNGISHRGKFIDNLLMYKSL